MNIERTVRGRDHVHETWSFAGSAGGRVLAEAFVADGAGPVVVVGHGRGNSRHATYVSGLGRLWGRRGITVIGADAPRHGDRAGVPIPEAVTAAPDLMEEWLSDHRILLDVIAERLVDRPIGYLGVSMGGMFGVHLMASEPRIAAGCFAVLGSNRVSFPQRYPGLDGEWLEAARVVDPLGSAGAISPRPVLVVCADSDEIFSRESAIDLYDAFGRPKELTFLPGAHAGWQSPARWFRRMETFFVDELGASRWSG